MSTETEIVARLLVRGYNEHIRLHGPDDSRADGVSELPGGHGFIVERDNETYAVVVRPTHTEGES